MKRCGIFTATAIVAAILAGGPAAAQDSASARLEALKAEINELRNEVEALKRDVAEGREEARGATGQMAAAKTEPPADAPSIRVSSSNQPTICSSDGRNCISLTSRLQLDFGGYNYRPNTTATTPQNLVGGVIARRAKFGVIGAFLNDWGYSIEFEGGGSGGGSGVVLDKAYLSYSGLVGHSSGEPCGPWESGRGFRCQPGGDRMTPGLGAAGLRPPEGRRAGRNKDP